MQHNDVALHKRGLAMIKAVLAWIQQRIEESIAILARMPEGALRDLFAAR